VGSHNSREALAWVAQERDEAVLGAANTGGGEILSKIGALTWSAIQSHLVRVLTG
jgi:hypothetical protein